MPPSSGGSKPGVSQLLIASAIDADLRRQLLESPDEIFPDYNLSDEEMELLRRPDHRLLRLFGEALREQAGEQSPDRVPETGTAALQPHAVVQARTLPEMSLAVTLVPCAQYQNGKLSALSYAVWVDPLAEGVDPASLPPPPGATLPGEPLSPLHAVLQVSAIQLPDQDGKPRVGLTASLRQSSNIYVAPSPESMGRPDVPPFGSDGRSAAASAAVDAVRDAASGDRYDRLIDLLHVLRGGELK